MWLNGYVAFVHHVYVGISKTAVSRATSNLPEYRGSVLAGGNVFHLKTGAEPNTEYFWRVDAEVSPSEVYRGDVWSFTTGDGDVTQLNGGSQWCSVAVLIIMLAFLNLIMY